MEGYKKKTFRHLCQAVLLTLCLTAVFRSGIFADARNVETRIPFSIKADGSGHTYTVTLTPVYSGDDGIQTKTCKEGEDGFFTVSHTVPDIYVYTVTEEDDGTEKITFDHSSYTVYVDVSSDDEGGLSSAVAAGKNETPAKTGSILFSNTFYDGSETQKMESETTSETKTSETATPETRVTETAPETKTSETTALQPETAKQTETQTELPAETQQTETGRTETQSETDSEAQLHSRSTGETETESSEETQQEMTAHTEEQTEPASEIQSESGSIPTGDSSRIFLYAVMAAASLAVGGVSAVYMSKRKRR